MKIFNLFLFSFFLISFSFSQSPEIEWEHLYCDGESNVTFVLTPDDCAVVITSTYSAICNEKNETGQGGLDYWIYKIDANGTILWQNVIGGSGDDNPTTIKATSDGGYIVAGSSNSPISGDKTEPNHDYISPYHTDMWILKLDATGNIIWQNTIGGNKNENSAYIEQIAGGGYIVSCTSYSPISGDKMEETVGGTGYSDYWILKLNSAGNIIWQNTIGGNGDEYIRSVHQTADGGFICAGSSGSGISGDKTEALIASTDYWIVKLNNSGNIIWQNTIGSNGYDSAVDIILEPGGTYTLGGYTAAIYTPYYEIIRLNNTGSVIWKNTIPTGEDSWLKSISKTSDGGYILGGTTNGSGPSCNSYGWECWNLWVIKTDALGDVEWNTALGSGDDDGPAFVRQTSDGGYLVSGFAGIDEEGDISDKESLYSGAWLVKLNDSVCVPSAEICNTIDDNCNGIIDEDIVDNITVSAGGPIAFCSGGSVILSVVSHTGTSLQWKKNGEDIPGATSVNYTANAKGIYTCQTTSACAFAISEWIEVEVYKKPNANILPSGPTTFCEGGSVTLTANAGGGQSYQWYKNGIIIAGATNINYVATSTGSYRCQVIKNFSGCSKLSNIIAVNVTCREDNESSSYESFTIYPNPSSEIITIALTGTTLITDYSLIIVTDLSGKAMAQYQLTSSSTEIDISNYPSGIYFVKVINDNKQLTEIFIKQ